MTQSNELIERARIVSTANAGDPLAYEIDCLADGLKAQAETIADLQQMVKRLVDAGNEDVALMKEMGSILGRADKAEAELTSLRAKLERAKEVGDHVEQLVELLEIIKEHWIDYDHVYSISVNAARLALAEREGPDA